MDWFVFLPPDGSRKASTIVLYSIVNQLDAVRMVYAEQSKRIKRSAGLASNKHIGGIIMIYAGINVAKGKHDCFILRSEGEVLADA